MVVREPILNIWIPDRSMHEFNPSNWVLEGHDSDRDGVPNWKDMYPLDGRLY